MKYLLCLPILLSLTTFALAEDAKPNTLAPKDVADGWLLLFDGESTFGWKALDNSKWTVLEGMLSPQGADPAKQLLNTAFSNYDLMLDYQVKKDSKAALLLDCDADGRRSHAHKSASGDDRGAVVLQSFVEGWMVLTVKVRDGALMEYHFTASGKSYGGATFKDDPRPATEKPSTGHLALAGNNFIVHSVILKPLGPKSIFNGKDLDNWKVFAGTTPNVKSKFSVTKEGTISLKNGPGDLQSKDAWADFVLQIECISNGRELNSGVFFRCRPDEYQQGYEAQIHNGWTDKPEKEYTIEEFDPKTNEPKEKTKIKSNAKDYGTGAIYRRMPARREVAKDNEWFIMTVVAQGRHIATWVNGIQVVDWTDNRPVKDNARNGCKLQSGPISLQGHDPTTDLNFRNIRIAELAPLAKVEKQPEEKK